MKRLRKSVLMAAALLLGAGNLAAMTAGSANSWIEQWHMLKSGRSSAMEEARVKAELGDTAYREDKVAPAPTAWVENLTRAKLGRSSPMEEARLRAEQADTAYREEAKPEVPAGKWLDNFLGSKMGRTR